MRFEFNKKTEMAGDELLDRLRKVTSDWREEMRTALAGDAKEIRERVGAREELMSDRTLEVFGIGVAYAVLLREMIEEMRSLPSTDRMIRRELIIDMIKTAMGELT